MKPAELEIANLVKDFRLKADLTQYELAQKLGYDTPQFVSLFERGLSKIPLEILGKLVVLLGIPETKVQTILVEIYKDEVKSRMTQGKKTAKGA